MAQAIVTHYAYIASQRPPNRHATFYNIVIECMQHLTTSRIAFHHFLHTAVRCTPSVANIHSNRMQSVLQRTTTHNALQYPTTRICLASQGGVTDRSTTARPTQLNDHPQRCRKHRDAPRRVGSCHPPPQPLSRLNVPFQPTAPHIGAHGAAIS